MIGTRIGVCSWSLGPADSRDLLESLRQLEIGAVQLSLVPLLDDPARWEHVAEDLRAAGVGVPSGMLAMAGEDYSTLASIRRTGGLRPDDTWPVNRRRAAAAAALAAELGLELVTFHAGFLEPDGGDRAHRAVLERIAVVADLFAAAGVQVALETGQETADTLAAVLGELDRPHVGVNFDPANMILYGMGDPVAALERLSGWVRQVHVKDALPAGEPGAWGREVPAGRGAVAWEAFFGTAESIRPRVDYIIERESGEERREDIIAAQALIERHVAFTVRDGAPPAGERTPRRD